MSKCTEIYISRHFLIFHIYVQGMTFKSAKNLLKILKNSRRLSYIRHIQKLQSVSTLQNARFVFKFQNFLPIVPMQLPWE